MPYHSIPFPSLTVESNALFIDRNAFGNKVPSAVGRSGEKRMVFENSKSEFRLIYLTLKNT